MLLKRLLYLTLFLSVTVVAQESLEEAMKKALVGINEIEVLKKGEPKIVSEEVVVLKDNNTVLESSKEKSVDPRSSSKTTETKAIRTKKHKKIRKNKIRKHKTKKHKKHPKHKKRRKHKKHKKHKKHHKQKKVIDINDLPIAQTYGVVNVSDAYEGKY